jgi:sec-independent protein translocase protein TatA
MFGIGPPELIVIFLIILILFGAKRLPELARSLGRSINEFKNATTNIKSELDLNDDQASSNHQSEEDEKKNAEKKESSKKDSSDLTG